MLPETIVKQYQSQAGFYFSTVSRIDQQVIGGFFLQGHFERHLNRMRKIYKGKHDLLLQGLKGAGLPARIMGESAGLHLLLEFGDSTARASRIEEELMKLAEAEGVRVYALSDYYIKEEAHKPTIIIGFARLKEEQITEGIECLKKAWKSKDCDLLLKTGVI